MYICTQQYAFEAAEKKGLGSVSAARRQSFFFSLFFNHRFIYTEMYDSNERERHDSGGRGKV